MRRAAILIAVAVCAGLLLFAIGAAAAKHRKRIKVPATVTLNETPVLSGTVAATRGCRRKRYVQIYRASNGALIGSDSTDDAGAFSAPGGYSGRAYAVAFASAHKQGRKRIKCLQTPSPVVSVGLADLTVTQIVTDPSLATGPYPRYDVTVTNLGPHTAQEVLLTETPNPIPANGNWTLSTADSSPECSLAAGAVSCTVGTLPPGQSATRRITLACGPVAPPADHFDASASVSSSIRDPDPANNTAPNLLSQPCA